MTSRAEMQERPPRADRPDAPWRPALPDVDSSAGFSVVELLIALSVLAITLVALIGLATTSSFMVTSARQRAAMVNAAAGYLERARQEPFANVGTPGGDPAGGLVAQSTTSTPYVITITPTVTWGRPEDPTNHGLKTVTLAVSSQSASGGSRMELTASALLADVGAAGVPAPAVTAPLSSIVSPGGGSVVWGNAVSVTASGSANSPARRLIWLDVFDGMQSLGASAVEGQMAQHTWVWNTTLAREGNHRLVPRVTVDSGTAADGGAVTLTVDNLPPTVPGAPVASFVSSTEGRLVWSPSTDGSDVDGVTAMPASHYVVSAFRQPVDAAQAADYARWSPVAGLSPLSVAAAPGTNSPLVLAGLMSFSRYAVAVSSSSPDRGVASGLLSAPAVTVGVTRSTASGTWNVSYANKRYTVTVPVNVPVGPTFPWSGTATTRIYRLTSPTQSATSGTLLATVSSASPNWSAAGATDVQTTSGQPVTYYYVAVTTLTPAGYGGAPTTVTSCVLGPPADLTTTGSRQLVVVGW